jgi:hypothetical protein
MEDKAVASKIGNKRDCNSMMILSYTGEYGQKIFGNSYVRNPDFNKLKSEISSSKLKSVCVEIPLVSEKYCDDAKAFIDWLVADFINSIILIVNDYGMLSYCQSNSIKGRITLIIGRLIGYQYNSIPWIDLIISEESEEIQSSLYANYWDSDVKISFLKRFEVSGIYCNYSESRMCRESIDRIRSKSISVFLHNTENIMAINPTIETDFNDEYRIVNGDIISNKYPVIRLIDGVLTTHRELTDQIAVDGIIM